MSWADFKEPRWADHKCFGEESLLAEEQQLRRHWSYCKDRRHGVHGCIFVRLARHLLSRVQLSERLFVVFWLVLTAGIAFVSCSGASDDNDELR